MAVNSFSIVDLPWLPRLSETFRAQVRAVEPDSASDWGVLLRQLATQHIGLTQAISLSQSLVRLSAKQPSKALTSFRLGLVSNATTDFLRPMLIATALRFGIALEIIAADFGQIMQEAVDPDSQLNRAKPDAVLLAIDHRGWPLRSGGSTWPPFDAATANADLSLICQSFRKHSGAICFVQTLAAPPELLFGSLDAATPGTLRSAIAAFNARLIEDTPRGGDVIVDIDWLAQSVGLDAWYDDRQWYLARTPFAQKALPLYADFICRIIAALRGKARKCLILDLDNTLWGGIIGDDGIDNIALSPGDPRGEAFRTIQSTAADLRRRGVVLAVCSKNDAATALEVFRTHPEMILKESDIAVFMANWDDKATNIERIASQLELGLDAMVLLDDNPAERAQVRQALPQVAVPELDEDPSSYARTLLAAGYFESTAFTREDLARAEQYQGNADRARVLAGSRNLDDFLHSLQMRMDCSPFNAVGRKRIAQLINKTNQFNVTTRRYTEQEVAEFESSAQHYTLQISVKDRFGDNGMISVVICTKRNVEWDIDTWLMSCRVLNRKVEEAVCNRIARDAKAAGAKRLLGTFAPTDRNSIVRELYSKLGFKLLDEQPTASRWVLDLESFTPFTVFFGE